MAQSPPQLTTRIYERRKPSSASEDAAIAPLVNFPTSNHLIVSTTKGVYTWTFGGVNEIFRSESGGIVTAKKISDGNDLLAVADSQIVLLHDTKKDVSQSHRLMGIKGQVRRLQYHSDCLYFTTSIQHMVQRYSLTHNILLPPMHIHPSSPTVFSLNQYMLLSASAQPQVIQLSNLLSEEPPIFIKPDASSSAVVTAAFHPDTPNIFLLAFGDGTLAAYDASHFFGQRGRNSSAAAAGKGGEIGNLKKLHTVTTTSSYPDRSTPVSVGEVGVGIAAIAFVPGSSSTAASVGADGRCCIVDFGYNDPGSSKVLMTWHVRGGATSVSILPYKRCQDQKVTVSDFLVAIGRQDGTVRLYDLEGKLILQQSFDPADGSRILDVEWLEGSGITDTKDGIPRTGTHVSVRDQHRRSYPFGFDSRDNQLSGGQVLLRSQSQRPNAKRRSNSSARLLQGEAEMPGIDTEARGHSANSGVTRTKGYHRRTQSSSILSSYPIASSQEDLLSNAANTSVPPNVPPRPVEQEGSQYSIGKAELTSMKAITNGDLRVLDLDSPSKLHPGPRSEDQSPPTEQHVSPGGLWTDCSSASQSPLGARATGSDPSADPSSTSTHTPMFNSNLDTDSSTDPDSVIDWVASSSYTPHPDIRKQSRSKVAVQPSTLLPKTSRFSLKPLPTKLATAAITQRLVAESQSKIAINDTIIDDHQPPDTSAFSMGSFGAVSMPLPMLRQRLKFRLRTHDGSQDSSENQIVATFSAMHDVLKAEMEVFKSDLRREAKAQKDWFLEEVRGMEQGKIKLARENERLRDELARLERGRGSVRRVSASLSARVGSLMGYRTA